MNEKGNLTFDVAGVTLISFFVAAIIFGVVCLIGVFVFGWSAEYAAKIFGAGYVGGGLALSLSLWTDRKTKIIAVLIGICAFAVTYYVLDAALHEEYVLDEYVPIDPVEVKPINESCILVIFDDFADGKAIMFQYPEFHGLKLFDIVEYNKAIYCEEADA